MTQALAPPFLVASLVLCVAGAFKLRSPRTAASALGIPERLVRALSVGEIILGAACALHPTRALALALALVYQLFAGVAVVLKRRRVACGCFGDNDIPVSPAHVIASELLGAVAVAAAIASPRGLSWVADQPPAASVVLALGVAGAVYATVLVFTGLPRAWTAWSGE
ncbi:MAG TPA: MauE/DoxX family redox-associated membrane protein [Solirubrobacteraceae bacterium]|nr:MauE/DoxX family redox-associated membrane protein [Solirubrobacteraceae bacterium]